MTTASSPSVEGTRTVLLVDDDPTQLKLNRFRLEEEGFSVQTAASAEAALAIALRTPPDAIVSDVLMGEIDGFALCRRIRQSKTLAGVPVILLSSHFGGDEDRALAASVGASGLALRTPEFNDEIALLRAALTGPGRPLAVVPDAVVYEEHLGTYSRQLAKVMNQARLAEERYRTLFDNANDTVSVLSLDGVILDANERWREVMGLSPRELIGRHIREFAPTGLADKTAAAYGRSIASGGGRNQAVPIRRADGTIIYMEFSNSIVEIDDEPVVFAIGHDVTASVEALAALRDAEQRYRSLVERIPEVIWTANEREEITFVTANIEKVSGFAPDEFRAGGVELWLSRIHEHDRERVMRTMCGDNVEQLDLEYRWLRKDETWIWIRSRVIAAYDCDGVRHFDWMFSDVTEKKQLEQRFRQAQKMEAIGQLTGGIAHDFNNLLAAILANCHFLLDDLADNDPRHADAEEIKVAGERAAALTRQLLAFSRRQVLEPTIVDLNTTVLHLKSMLARLLGEDIDLSFRPADGLDAVRIDVGQLEQVIMNLAVNARDAMPGGGSLAIDTAHVEVDAEHSSGHSALLPGSYVMLTVTDSGCGMDAETQQRLFEPFFTTKSVGKGTGLGLSTCYGIIKQSGGDISVESELGRGTTVRVYLPRVDGRPEETKKTTGRIDVHGKGEIILLVEDNERVRAAIRRMLKARGYRVIVASDGLDGIEVARRHEGPIDLILSDVVMPGASGPDVVAAVREISSGVRFLFMSGHTDHAALKSRALQEKMNFIQKPFAPDALAKKVREVLDA